MSKKIVPVAKMLNAFLESVEKYAPYETGFKFTQAEKKMITKAGYELETDAIGVKRNEDEDDQEEFGDYEDNQYIKKEASKKVQGKKVYTLVYSTGAKTKLSVPFSGEENLNELKKILYETEPSFKEESMSPSQKGAMTKRHNIKSANPKDKDKYKDMPPSRFEKKPLEEAAPKILPATVQVFGPEHAAAMGSHSVGIEFKGVDGQEYSVKADLDISPEEWKVLNATAKTGGASLEEAQDQDQGAGLVGFFKRAMKAGSKSEAIGIIIDALENLDLSRVEKTLVTFLDDPQIQKIRSVANNAAQRNKAMKQNRYRPSEHGL
jgi:hypothetical protein